MARNEPKLPEITQNGKKSPKMHKSEIFNFHQFSPNFHPFSPIFTHFHPFSPIFTNFRPSISSLVYHEIKTHEICRRNDIFKKSHFFQAPIFSNFLQFSPIFSNFSQFSLIFFNFFQFFADFFQFRHL